MTLTLSQKLLTIKERETLYLDAIASRDDEIARLKARIVELEAQQPVERVKMEWTPMRPQIEK